MPCTRPCFPSIAIDDDEGLWSGRNKNRDVRTGPLACPFARSLAPLTHSLAPPCLLCLRAPLRSFVCSLAHYAHYQARGKVGIFMSQNQAVLNHTTFEIEMSPPIYFHWVGSTQSISKNKNSFGNFEKFSKQP